MKTIMENIHRVTAIDFEALEAKQKQAAINIATMFRQCGLIYDSFGNPSFDRDQLQEWFEKELHKKDFTIYDTI